MPRPDGTQWDFTPGEMEEIEDLEYTYDDLTPAPGAQPDVLVARASRLGLAVPGSTAGSAAMSTQRTVEMLGTTGGAISLAGEESQRRGLRLDPATASRMSDSLSQGSAETGLPDRAFLNLENVRSRSDAVLFQVYVGLPDGADPAQNPQHLAGTVSLFGTTLASQADGPHAGNGITQVLEITNIVDRLHLDGAFDASQIEVELVPVGSIPKAAAVEIGNISLYRQSE